MLSEDVLFKLMKNSLYPSETLIKYLLDVPEKQALFEKQLRKWLHSSNLKTEDGQLLIKIYENQAKKYYREREQDIRVVIKNSSDLLPKDQAEKKKQEVANIAITDVSDVIIHKNYQFDLFALEFPLFSLKLDKLALDYEFTSKNGITITLHSTTSGRATIQDADLWLYCISKMMQLIYEEKTLTRRIVFNGYDYLKKTGRETAGPNYKQIIKSLERLKGTILKTNKTIETWEVGAGLGLLDSYEYIKDRKTGKIIQIEVVLPQWLYRYLVNKKVVAIDPEYLDLKPLEKRLYQIAKFHCRNDSLNNTFKLDYFAKKVGSSEALRNFRSKVKKIKEKQPLPDFLINYDKEEDKIWFTLRKQKKQKQDKEEQHEQKSESEEEIISQLNLKELHLKHF